MRKPLIFWMKSFSFLLLVSKWSFFFWAFSSMFIAWFFTSCVKEAIPCNWTQEAKMLSWHRELYPVTADKRNHCHYTAVCVTKMSQYLSGYALQLLIDRSQTVADVPGMIQSCCRRTHCPIASLSSAYVITLIVSATKTTAWTVWTTAIDTTVTMTTTYLEGTRESQ